MSSEKAFDNFLKRFIHEHIQLSSILSLGRRTDWKNIQNLFLEAVQEKESG